MVSVNASISLDEDQAWAQFRRLLDARHYEEAEQTCRAALEASPGDFRWRLGLSLALLGARKNDLALRLALTLVNDRPDHPESYRTLSLAWLGLGKKEIALEWANLAHKKSPTPEYTRFVERVRRASGVQSPERAALDESAGLPAPAEEGREVTRIVNLATLKAAVAEPTKERNDLVTQIFQRAAVDKTGLSPAVQLETQIHRMFGASLFGVWDTSTRDIELPSPVQLRKTSDRRRLYQGVAAALMLAVIGGLLVRTGVTQQSQRVAQTEVEALEKLVLAGALPQAAELLPKVETILDQAGQTGRHQGVLLRTQAVLYRHHDAKPERRAFVEKALEAPGLAPTDQHLARALLASWVERSALQEELTALANKDGHDAEPAFLLATALDGAGDYQAAQKQYQVAEEAEPAYLAHAAYQVELALRRQEPEEIMRLVELMRDVHPGSPWTKLAIRMLPPEETPTEPQVGEETSTKTAAAPVAIPPVVQAEVALFEARRLSADHHSAEAIAQLEIAVALVHEEPAFLLDFATRLADGAPALATHLTSLPAWPSERPAAETLSARLHLAMAKAPIEEDSNPSELKASPDTSAEKPAPRQRSSKRKRSKRRAR